MQFDQVFINAKLLISKVKKTRCDSAIKIKQVLFCIALTFHYLLIR